LPLRLLAHNLRCRAARGPSRIARRRLVRLLHRRAAARADVADR
jgi:hypothetical protein